MWTQNNLTQLSYKADGQVLSVCHLLSLFARVSVCRLSQLLATAVLLQDGEAAAASPGLCRSRQVANMRRLQGKSISPVSLYCVKVGACPLTEDNILGSDRFTEEPQSCQQLCRSTQVRQHIQHRTAIHTEPWLILTKRLTYE